MTRSDVARLLASRPSGAAVASLFSDPTEPAIVLRKPEIRRGPTLADLGRKLVARTRDVLLSQVPCEDVTFNSPATLQVVRRMTQI